jgi:nucleotide-binding universal stress UspA family protein
MSISVSPKGRLSIASIVFATDFSPASRNAGFYAAAIAAHFEAELVVIHAFVLRQSAMEAEAHNQTQSRERIDLSRQLHSTATSLAPTGDKVRAALLDGDPSERIAAFADGIPNSLLILGTHGGSGVERHLIGSVAERSLRRAACPTITIGPKVPQLSGNQLFTRMLYATDCSAMASAAAPLACAMASSFASVLKVISIVDDNGTPIPDILADLEFQTHRAIADQLDGQCDHFSESRALASPGRARQQILKYAADTKSDLIILGVHRRKTIEMFDRNSVTIQLITEAHCPVLTVTRDSLIRKKRP